MQEKYVFQYSWKIVFEYIIIWKFTGTYKNNASINTIKINGFIKFLWTYNYNL